MFLRHSESGILVNVARRRRYAFDGGQANLSRWHGFLNGEICCTGHEVAASE